MKKYWSINMNHDDYESVTKNWNWPTPKYDNVWKIINTSDTKTADNAYWYDETAIRDKENIFTDIMKNTVAKDEFIKVIREVIREEIKEAMKK